MRRLAVVSVTLAAGLVVPVAAAPARDARGAGPGLHAQLEECTTGPAPADRVAAFAGSMPARAGAERMAMRFVLQRATRAKGPWRNVAGVPGFRTWERSEPNRAGFVFHKRVAGLAVPARYRAVVSFRWEDGDGVVIARARRRTRACRQPDLRPDLVAGALTATAGPVPGTVRYAVAVRNDGRRPAGPFSVSVGADRVEVAGLEAGASTTAEVVGVACPPGSFVPVVLDADGRVDEAREDGERSSRRCPAIAP